MREKRRRGISAPGWTDEQMEDRTDERRVSTTEKGKDENTMSASKERAVYCAFRLKCSIAPVTGFHGYSSMASSWSAKSSNMLPMSSRMLTVVFCSATELKHIKRQNNKHFHFIVKFCRCWIIC